jgi:hypothetical protein
MVSSCVQDEFCSTHYLLEYAVKPQLYKSEVRHPRCVSNKSNYKVYVYIVKHNYIVVFDDIHIHLIVRPNYIFL